MAKAREVAGIDMAQMSHFKQCRADAVGKLHQHDEHGCQAAIASLKPAKAQSEKTVKLTNDNHIEGKPMNQITAVSASITALCSDLVPTDNFKVRIAVASSTGTFIDTHFGHAKTFHIYEITAQEVYFTESRSIAQYCTGKEDCDENRQDELEETGLTGHLACLADCQQVLCSRIGISPWQQLEAQDIMPKVDYAMLEVHDALNIIRIDLCTEHNMKKQELKDAC